MPFALRTSCCLTGAVLLLAILVVAGCSGGDGRQAVTGTVTLDGQPLDSGSVNFQPADPSAASSSGAAIRDGEFTIPRDKGLKPGAYKVSVRATKETGRMIEDPQMGQIAERVAVKFQEEGTLEVEVGDGKNHFDLELTSAE